MRDDARLPAGAGLPELASTVRAKPYSPDAVRPFACDQKNAGEQAALLCVQLNQLAHSTVRVHIRLAVNDEATAPPCWSVPAITGSRPRVFFWFLFIALWAEGGNSESKCSQTRGEGGGLERLRTTA